MAEFLWGVFVGAGIMGSLWMCWMIAEATHKARGYTDEYRNDQS
jgi:hypothetical protein